VAWVKRLSLNIVGGKAKFAEKADKLHGSNTTVKVQTTKKCRLCLHFLQGILNPLLSVDYCT